jgi:putative modified peptide
MESDNQQLRFYVSLDEGITARNARDILEKLVTDSELRARIEDNPRAAFREIGLDYGDLRVPDKVKLPDPEEIKKALDQIDALQQLEFRLDPFGAYYPGQQPFIGILLLALAAAV